MLNADLAAPTRYGIRVGQSTIFAPYEYGIGGVTRELQLRLTYVTAGPMTWELMLGLRLALSVSGRGCQPCGDTHADGVANGRCE